MVSDRRLRVLEADGKTEDVDHTYAIPHRYTNQRGIHTLASKKGGNAPSTGYICVSGIFLLVISLRLDDWLGSEDGTRRPQTGLLGIIFFSCVCLASTQDVAVDGWSLTMLKR